MMVALKSFESGVIIDEVYYTPAQIRHEVDVMTEVIDQSKMLLQLAGQDELSIFSKACEDVGLGSLFDPESEARKKFGKLWGFDNV